MRRFWRDVGGATAIEYALIAGLASVMIIGAVRTIGLKLNSGYIAPVASALT